MRHELKTWANAWEAVRDGRKRFEWRLDDRGFEVGDELVLRRWQPGVPEHNQGLFEHLPALHCRVTYILRGLFNIPPGYCVMSIELIDGKAGP